MQTSSKQCEGTALTSDDASVCRLCDTQTRSEQLTDAISCNKSSLLSVVETAAVVFDILRGLANQLHAKERSEHGFKALNCASGWRHGAIALRVSNSEK